MKMISLAGKVIAVTGAASGMGFATAKCLYARGASLSLTDIREDALAKAVSEIKAAHPPLPSSSGSSNSNDNDNDYDNTIITTVVDIRQSEQVDSWIARTISHFGRLDGAANIAGVLGRSFGKAEVTEIENDEFDFVMGTNFRGLFYCMRAELRVMKAGACVVNAASSTGLEGHPKNAVYSATKHAVIGLTKSAAGEVGARGIRVNCVAPGIINTPMVASIGALDEGKLESNFVRVPLGRMGRPEEAASTFVYLLSDESSYVTGATYVVDGGMLC